MLEALVLNNTERLIAAQPYLGAPSFELLYGDKQANSPASLIPPGVYADMSLVSANLASRICLLSDGSAKTLKIDTTLRGAAAVTTDDANRLLRYFVEQPDGVIWATGNATSYYGLYRRTVGGSWTQVLSDSGTSQIHRWNDGTVYWVSNTGNFYTLANGSATVSSNPGFGANFRGYANPASGFGIHEVSHILARLNSNTGYTVPVRSALTQGEEASFVKADDTVPGQIPIGALLAGMFWDNYSVAPYRRSVRLDGTYSLFTIKYTANALDRNFARHKIALVVLNRTTGTAKRLGVLQFAAILNGTTDASDIGFVGGWLESGLMRLLLAGQYGYDGTVYYRGVIRVDIPYTLDF